MAPLNREPPFFHLDFVGLPAGMPPEGSLHVGATAQRALDVAETLAGLYEIERSRICRIFHLPGPSGVNLAKIISRGSAAPWDPVSWLGSGLRDYQVETYANLARAVILSAVRPDLRRNAKLPFTADIAVVILDPQLTKKLSYLFSAYGLMPCDVKSRGSTSLLASSVPENRRLRMTFQGVEPSSFEVC